MSKLLNKSLYQLIIYAAVVLACNVPVYHYIISWLWKYEMLEHHIVITREAAKDDSYLIIMAVTILTALFFLLLLVGFIILNRKISNKLWQPFYQSLASIKKFDLNQQAPVVFEDTKIDEFSELNQSLNKLITGNIAAYKQQKEFADNASHELQTPLAIIQFKLELLLQQHSITQEQYILIEDALKALTRVSRINKNLLLLAKMEGSHYMDKESIDFSALLSTAVNQFKPFAEGREIDFSLELQESISVNGNKTLTEILINNLITNAIRNTDSGSTISISLSGSRFLISNPGKTALQSEQLFKRFASVQTDSPGTGLGLSLVKEIAARYGWTISYAFEQSHHIFSLNF